MFNILLSYPRSANSWVRYAVEFVSRRPTTNSKRLYHCNGIYKKDAMVTREAFGADAHLPAILLKRHNANLPHDSWTKEDRFIFVVRDYRECILRNIAENTETKITNAVEMFVGNLEFFDTFEGDKVLIYYEDLMTRPEDIFNEIFSFLNINNGPRYVDFIQNIKKHQINGVRLYHDKAQTQGAANKLNFHQANASRNVVDMVDRKIRDRCPRHLYDKYLYRYRPY